MIFSAQEKMILVASLEWSAIEHNRSSVNSASLGLRDAAMRDGKFSVECSRIAAGLLAGGRATRHTLSFDDSERATITAAAQWAAMTHDKLAKDFVKERKPDLARKAAAASGECARIADMLKEAG